MLAWLTFLGLSGFVLSLPALNAWLDRHTRF